MGLNAYRFDRVKVWFDRVKLNFHAVKPNFLVVKPNFLLVKLNLRQAIVSSLDMPCLSFLIQSSSLPRAE